MSRRATDSVREVIQGVQVQGDDESIVYTVETTNWASSPTSPSMVVKRESDGSDVTSSTTSGSISTSGDIITLKNVESLTAGERYRVELQFTVAGSYEPGECFFFIDCEE